MPYKDPEYHKHYRETHHDKILAYQATHKEQNKINQKKYRETHKEEVRLRSLEWDKKHPEHSLNWRHARGINKPMSENRECALYLGVHIAERVLSKLFNNVQRMPFGNPGYDFLCGRGFKIDCKSRCLYHDKRGNRADLWIFSIAKNTQADYFLLLAFNNRADLEPQHIWMIPGSKVAHLTNLSILDSANSLAKWAQYERPLDKIIACCESLREDERIEASTVV
jgi:hypothetical protein